MSNEIKEPRLAAIQVGNHLTIQGTYVKDADEGRYVIEVDGKLHTGRPVNAPEASADMDLQP